MAKHAASAQSQRSQASASRGKHARPASSTAQPKPSKTGSAPKHARPAAEGTPGPKPAKATRTGRGRHAAPAPAPKPARIAGAAALTAAVVGGTLVLALPALDLLQNAGNAQRAPQTAITQAATQQAAQEQALLQGMTTPDQRILDLRKNDFCLTQSQEGRCTIASCAMMLRRISYLNGLASWDSVTEDSLHDHAWVWDAGLKQSFAAHGYQVGSFTWKAGAKPKDRQHRLANLLQKHPEGLVVYDAGLPHALLLTRFDADSQTFYCADPAGGAYSGKEIPLEKSWNGEVRGDQDEALSHITRCWYVEGPATTLL